MNELQTTEAGALHQDTLVKSYYKPEYRAYHFVDDENWDPLIVAQKITVETRRAMEKGEASKSGYKPKQSEKGMTRIWGPVSFVYADADGNEGATV